MEGTQTFALKIPGFLYVICFGQKFLLSTGGASQASVTFFVPGFQKFSYSEVRSNLCEDGHHAVGTLGVELGLGEGGALVRVEVVHVTPRVRRVRAPRRSPCRWGRWM